MPTEEMERLTLLDWLFLPIALFLAPLIAVSVVQEKASRPLGERWRPSVLSTKGDR